ncbi:Flavin monooxygenase-like protein [Cordyceps fumosorosea ARSEF 2679]|uniref:Flavin monooxygenase-like protein n=1 Tax=Cordyceps fumosorosea (strain ARSEF 2679) TaxID=1081104 RepID=A0A162JE59_CORFA|nr:Flavin monooxygenase-like protein [Cordyceps fumosorosea ARSEF 2679]OAA43048.1 Flavin monooxygenase-like protein [Cordyceps fumosorosea ARSEF 2679]
MAIQDYDVVIIGAGISGINFAYRLKERNPNLTYCILEARSEIGGTWSLFKYPGLRSDSDLYTFSFPWKPWASPKSIAQADLILDYLREAVQEQGIDKKIKFNHKVKSLDFNTSAKSWTFTCEHDGKAVSVRSRFTLVGTGYYDYDEPMQATIPGIESFKGPVIHPQFWPQDLDYTGKNMVIIGSGATAVTLVPSVAEKVSHVTMLQRSPGYILSVPGEGIFEWITKATLPVRLANAIIRFKWTLAGFLLIWLCRNLPGLTRRVILRRARGELPAGTTMDPDFSPRYNPFDQRMCLCPDGDFFQALRSGKGSVKTGEIAGVTARSIRLKSGEELHPDVIVTATGLKLALLGKAALSVDGAPVRVPERHVWRGSMLEGVPNLFFSFGYVDASWTLGADASAQLASRIISEVQQSGNRAICPRQTEQELRTMKPLPFMYLESTYVKKGLGVVPKAGDATAWLPRRLYWRDITHARWGDIRSSTVWS